MRLTIIGEGLRRISLAVMAALTVAVGFTTIAAPPASVSAASCRSVTHFLYSGENGHDFNWSQMMTVPNNSTCNDINIRAISEMAPNTGHCGNFRVRFYPSSGGSYTNAYQFKCSDPAAGSPLLVLASNVANGTVYRIEAQANWVSRYFTIVD